MNEEEMLTAVELVLVSHHQQIGYHGGKPCGAGDCWPCRNSHCADCEQLWPCDAYDVAIIAKGISRVSETEKGQKVTIEEFGELFQNIHAELMQIRELLELLVNSQAPS